MVLALLAMVGGGVYVWQHQATQSAPLTTGPQNRQSNVIGPTLIESSAPDPMTGWKTYRGQVEGLIIKYSGAWSLVESSDVVQGTDGITLTSPSGVEVVYSSDVSGLGGAGPVIPITPSHSEHFILPGMTTKLSFVEMRSDFKFGLLDDAHYPKQLLYYLLFPTIHNSQKQQWLFGRLIALTPVAYASVSVQQFYTMPEVVIAEQIINSSRYQ